MLDRFDITNRFSANQASNDELIDAIRELDQIVLKLEKYDVYSGDLHGLLDDLIYERKLRRREHV